MRKQEAVINIHGYVDLKLAEIFASKVRAAMQNEIKKIIIEFDNSAEIHSAELMSFLASVDKYMKENNGTLIFKCSSEEHKELLKLSNLGHLIDEGV